MNIALCDDDSRFLDVLEKNLLTYFSEKGISPKISRFLSGEELLECQDSFDMFFLDVEMNRINGIETGRKLKKINPHSIIFVVTSYDNYLDDAFKIGASRFLQKPLDILRLYKALDDALERFADEVVVFYDMKSGNDIRININEIIFIEIERKKLKIVTVNGTFYSNEKIDFWKDKLISAAFVSPHSSYIANLNYSLIHTRRKLTLAKKDANGRVREKYEIDIAPKKQAEIKRLFFSIFEGS